MDVILSIDAVRFPLTGIGRYTYELARALPHINGICSLKLMRGAELGIGLPDPATAAEAPAGRLARLQRYVGRSRLAVKTFSFADDVRKGRALRGHSDRLFHSPNFYLPPFDGPMVATFHDLSVFKWQECHPPERVRFASHQIKKALQRATLLITDSQFTRHEVADYFSWPLERIHVAPLASGPEFHPRSDAELAPRLAAFGLQPGGYAFFSGTIEPRKNLETLLTAYAALPPALRRRWPLVLCGFRGWRSELIHARIRQAELEGWVRYLGYAPHHDLPLLYAGARLFLFPSLYEGFGLPVLEAMASGVPVVASNVASVPEVAGQAARLCDPLDVEQWVSTIEAALADDAWRKASTAAGLTRARGFSWQRCALETVAGYKMIDGNPSLTPY